VDRSRPSARRAPSCCERAESAQPQAVSKTIEAENRPTSCRLLVDGGTAPVPRCLPPTPPRGPAQSASPSSHFSDTTVSLKCDLGLHCGSGAWEEIGRHHPGRASHWSGTRFASVVVARRSSVNTAHSPQSSSAATKGAEGGRTSWRRPPCRRKPIPQARKPAPHAGASPTRNVRDRGKSCTKEKVSRDSTTKNRW
jgi:hypothetical protein